MFIAKLYLLNQIFKKKIKIHSAPRFPSKIWWTSGQLGNGIWQWADTGDTWFKFDPASIETPSTTRVSLKTDNWMNAKSDRSTSYHKICEMGKFSDAVQANLQTNQKNIVMAHAIIRI